MSKVSLCLSVSLYVLLCVFVCIHMCLSVCIHLCMFVLAFIVYFCIYTPSVYIHFFKENLLLVFYHQGRHTRAEILCDFFKLSTRGLWDKVSCSVEFSKHTLCETKGLSYTQRILRKKILGPNNKPMFPSLSCIEKHQRILPKRFLFVAIMVQNMG